MLTRIRRARSDEQGFSLIELVVAMGLATFIGALSLTWFIGASNATNSTSDSDFATASARNVLQTWGRMLQLAGTPKTGGASTNGLTQLSPTSISFTAFLTNSGTCAPNTACSTLTTTPVTLALVGGQLIETVGSGHSSVDETSPTTVGTGGCLFTAYSSSGLLGCAGTLTTAQLATITSISLTFTVTTGGHARSFQTTAAFAVAAAPR